VLKPTSPRQVFAAKVERLQLIRWLAFPPAWKLPEDADALLHRFCTDDRMHKAWKLARLDDAIFEEFIVVALSIVGGARLRPEYRAAFQEWRSEIAKAQIVTRQFIEMCETSLVFRSPWHEAIGKDFPAFLTQAKKIDLALAMEAVSVREEEQDTVGGLSRKFGDGRAEMAHDLIHAIKDRSGQPHYEVVAALLNTILNTGDDDEITADAVRKICTRAAQRDRTIRSLK